LTFNFGTNKTPKYNLPGIIICYGYIVFENEAHVNSMETPYASTIDRKEMS